MAEHPHQALRSFAAFVGRNTGLHFPEARLRDLAQKMTTLAREAGCEDLDHYLSQLMAAPLSRQQMKSLCGALTIGETYFLRDPKSYRVLERHILPGLIAARRRGGKTLKIWSAGCSTGEEPYTIAMLLLEMGCLHGWRVEIVGSDISQRVVQHARKGIYTKASFRATEERYLKRFFTETDEGYRICDEVRELVTISQMNLFDANRLALLGKMDVIFCRNVIIYFDQTSKKRVVESFYNTLRGGGYLLLGHSESLMNLSTAFALRHQIGRAHV